MKSIRHRARRAEPGPAAPAAELEALLDAARAALRPGALDRSLGAILDAARRLVDADEGSIQLLDRDSMTLSVAAGRGLPAEAFDERVRAGHGISGTVAATGRPVLLRSESDVRRFGAVSTRRPIHAALSVPLATPEGLLGVLNLNRVAPARDLTDQDLRLAALFAETAAQAILNARLREAAERHAVELEALRQASLRLAAAPDLETLADAALEEALRISGSETGVLCVAGDALAVELTTFKGAAREHVEALLGHAAFPSLVSLREPQVIRSPAHDPRVAPLAREAGGRPVIVVPLTTHEGTSGVLVVAAPASAVRLLATYAVEAALAISTARLNRRLEREQAVLQTIVSSIHVPIVLVAGDGTFRAINNAAAEAFRLSPDLEIGRPARGKLGEPLETMLLDRSGDLTEEIERTTGSERRVYRARVSGARGTSQGERLLVLTDVTTQRELTQRKADFLAVIGHELRTPLTSIKGFAATLARRGDAVPADMRARAMTTILRQSEQLDRMIEDLLLVSGIQSERPPLRLAWNDVVEVADAVVQEMRDRHPGRRIALEHAVETLPAYTDRIKIEQILVHLLDNALKFSGPEAPVDVAIAEDGPAVTLSVRDRGTGIFSGDVPRLFRKFGQLDSSATRRHGGTGIGLFVCKRLVDALGGSISVDTVLGKGSTFRATIPRRTPEAAAGETDHARGPASLRDQRDAGSPRDGG